LLSNLSKLQKDFYIYKYCIYLRIDKNRKIYKLSCYPKVKTKIFCQLKVTIKFSIKICLGVFYEQRTWKNNRRIL
jgi:hypothetical protein